MFCNKAPKGFEKYFNPHKKDGKTEKPDESTTQEAPKKSASSQPKSSRSSGRKEFTFKFDKKIGGGSSDPFGDNKLMIFFAIGGLAFVAHLLFKEKGKEITWKEFVNE